MVSDELPVPMGPKQRSELGVGEQRNSYGTHSITAPLLPNTHLLQCLHPIGIARSVRASAGLPTGRRDQASEPGKLEACNLLMCGARGYAESRMDLGQNGPPAPSQTEPLPGFDTN